ncbi:MAG: hypothetical protein JWN46_277 [Acidimicrobiales bacterium]|nr:hypothetical protein [Acidimicrobiales bacterium]
MNPATPLVCPYCNSYGVERMYLATVKLDTCECAECGARWDQDPLDGSFRGRATRASVVMPRLHG